MWPSTTPPAATPPPHRSEREHRAPSTPTTAAPPHHVTSRPLLEAFTQSESADTQQRDPVTYYTPGYLLYIGRLEARIRSGPRIGAPLRRSAHRGAPAAPAALPPTKTPPIAQPVGDLLYIRMGERPRPAQLRPPVHPSANSSQAPGAGAQSHNPRSTGWVETGTERDSPNLRARSGSFLNAP